MKPAADRGERGAALLTVLLIVLVLSGISVSALEMMRRNQRLQANAASLAQAQWYAMGADAYLRSRAETLLRGEQARMAFLQGPQELAFPLDFGLMELTVEDGSTCINLNGVVYGAVEFFERDETGSQQLEELYVALGLSPAQSRELVDALVDWIDTAGTSDRGDRDDRPYSALAKPYLTGREPLAEVSELRAIQGYTPDVYERIRPFVCAFPQTGPSPVNVNALTEEDAPVLSALSSGALSVSAARRLIASRPRAGWQSSAEFLNAPGLQGLPVAETISDQIAVEAIYLDLTVRVVHLDAETVMTELLENRGGQVVSLARRWSEAS